MRNFFAVSGVIALLAPAQAFAQNESIVVYGPSSSDIGLNRDRIPGTLQRLDSEDLNRAKSGSILDSLGSLVAGVSLSDVQGNQLFQDVRYRGFAASPLQGTAQGVAVYQNGVRLNEAFGDTVNWDVIPENAIESLDVWTNNPIFGLNALGGAINLTMKNGFTFQGGTYSVQGGSFGQALGSVEYGVRDGDASLYLAADGLTDGGWRPRSQSGLVRLYIDGGFRFGTDSELHIVASGAVSSLGVVGPTPVDLLALRGDSTIYTSPQTTQNRVGSLALNGKTSLADGWQLSGTIYARNLSQRHVDGNDTEFDQCDAASSYAAYLCLGSDGFPAPDPFTGAAALDFLNQFALLDQNNAPLPFASGVVYGTIDRTATDAASLGGSLQLSSNRPLFGFKNYFTIGASLDHSSIAFLSTSTLAAINSDLIVALDPALPGSGSTLHSSGTTGFAPASLRAQNDYYGLYIVDALNLTPDLTFSAGVRLNVAQIDSNDRSGAAPELTGAHYFGRANPVVGAAWDTGFGVTFYGGYSQSSRAPTPLELDCADPNNPCLLENSLTGDPPLHQVSANTYEAGVRLPGMDILGGAFAVELGYYRTDINNDIVALASNILGRGYFANVPATARQGVDAAVRYTRIGWSAYVNYSYLQASYEFSGVIASPNNPMADGDGNVNVTPGRMIPLNPAHTLRFGGDVDVLDGWRIGFDASFTGSQYFDGDQSNQNPKLPSHWAVGLNTNYQLADNLQLYGAVDNLFNSRAATYGTFFEAGGVGALVTPALSDARSLSLLRPRSFTFGVKLSF